jgi:hypothetical protein
MAVRQMLFVDRPSDRLIIEQIWDVERGSDEEVHFRLS